MNILLIVVGAALVFFAFWLLFFAIGYTVGEDPKYAAFVSALVVGGIGLAILIVLAGAALIDAGMNGGTPGSR